MKRLAILVVVLSVFVVSLTGCGEDDDPLGQGTWCYGLDHE